jgi:tripartite-type tricarboxylate transporter receptor subunit TctC
MVNVTSSGTGNLTHLSGELFRMMTGIAAVYVPYRGTPAAHAGLIAGNVHAMFDAIGSAVPHIRSGSLRALGVTATARLPVLPDTPPISDTVPGYAVTGWLGIGVPRDTPAEIVERLNREVNAALAEPAMQARMADLGSTPLPGSAADFAKLIAEETEKWAKVVRFANLKAE